MYILTAISKESAVPRYHQVVLAKKYKGYKNLVKLTTISHLRTFKAKVSFLVLASIKATCPIRGTDCNQRLFGGSPQAILKADAARCGERRWLLFRNSDHGSPEDRVVNVEIIKIARELGIKFITWFAFYFYDVEAWCSGIQTDAEQANAYSIEYLKSAEEMSQLFRDHLADEVITEAIATTLEVGRDGTHDYGWASYS